MLEFINVKWDPDHVTVILMNHWNFEQYTQAYKAECTTVLPPIKLLCTLLWIACYCCLFCPVCNIYKENAFKSRIYFAMKCCIYNLGKESPFIHCIREIGCLFYTQNVWIKHELLKWYIPAAKSKIKHSCPSGTCAAFLSRFLKALSDFFGLKCILHENIDTGKKSASL